MIIVHLDFTGTYNEEMNYQENLLPRVNAAHGHTVYFITTCYMWDNGEEVNTAIGEFELDDGIHLIRMPYKRIINEFVTKKLRIVNGLFDMLEEISPDVIMIHCIQTFACFPIVRYAEAHPLVKLYADSHSDFNNSARNILSRYILHNLIYRTIANRITKRLDRMYYITYECKEFLIKMYNFPKEKMEYLPLGGELMSDNMYNEYRRIYRTNLGFMPDDIVLVHTGKMDSYKKTDLLIRNFAKTCATNIKLMLIGSLSEKLKSEIETIVDNDNRIKYIGWVDGNTLKRFLCASDIYIQPGTQSATMQEAACCRCALALYPYQSHVKLWGNGSVYYLKSARDIELFLLNISNIQKDIYLRRELSYKIASEKLDYNKIASRLY